MSELELLEQRRKLLLAEIKIIDEKMLLINAENKNTNDPEIPRMVKLKEASKEVGVSYDHLRQMCLQNRIVHIRVGSKYLVNMGSLYQYLNQGENGGE